MEENERRKIGRKFLSIFPTKITSYEAARRLGMKRSTLEKEESYAAYKIVMRMRAILREER